ncbi:bifunctional adenosylcobinamide kinase/adenosylcobinamide-phosphate guanylyltransferase [Herbaspirillum sp. RV1423]|uniref:bifunctional adenosylcobinamide kinase/adenosylcobinamide-phosphate guanylyltransferase n=1 Tax=Herbaspirillum sp. RV1423 TaxID=1443993 RepID=UPI0004BBA34F|nr:bifunctional adenosylcobinamide kinase/adenosylcobinamide-phosphate guanylyltransferase [Herbaspirillum sp. RV1423]
MSEGILNQRTLIFGGARSGKSAQAERLAAAAGKPVTYIATAAIGDDEMAARIAAHRRQRGAHHADWETVEEQLALGDAIARCSTSGNVVLVDCLTVWLSNLLFSENRDYPEVGEVEPPPRFAVERARLLQVLAQVEGEVVLVSNEVGMGIVPQGAVSRWFVDEAGRLNQAVAAICERVQFVAAGLPLELKGRAC